MAKNKKHILYFSNHLRGPKGAAGARSWHQARRLSRSYTLDVIIPSIDPVTSQKVTDEMYEGLDCDQVTVHKIWTSNNKRDSKLSRVLFFLSGMFSQFYKGLTVNKPDLVLCMSLPITLLFAAFVVSKFRRAPLVVDLRDLPFETALEIGYLNNITLVGILVGIENYCLKRASFILTNSPRYKPMLIERGVDSDKIHIAPLGYDDFDTPLVSNVSKWRSEISNSFDKPPALIAMYAGTIGYAFPVEKLLDVAEHLMDNDKVGFVFLGDGQRLEEFKKISEKKKLNCLFLGRVNKSDVSAICRGVDFCLYPAKEGRFSSAILGNKVFDYLGAEKPILYIGPDSAIADIILELRAGVVFGSDETEKMALKINEILSSPDLLDVYHTGAKDYRAAGYTASISADKLKKLIDNVVNSAI